MFWIHLSERKMLRLALQIGIKEPDGRILWRDHTMTLKEFDQYFADLCVEEADLLRRKGQEYSGKEDRHSNFKRLAVELNLKPEMILWVYLRKHLDGIASYVRGEYAGSEPIRGRIQDARNYLALLVGMIEDGATTAG